MKQLSGLDTSFLNMETATSFGHVTGLSIFERPDDPAWSPYETLKRQLASRLDVLEPFRRRLVEVPFGLDNPYWVDDPEFDLEYHVREAAVPPPGDERKLLDVVARIIGRPLDRSHPLWEVYVVEGLAGNRFAVLTKVHHATIDGASGAELMTILFDTEPSEPPDVTIAATHGLAPVPTDIEVLARAMADLARKPARLARLQLRALRALGDITRNRGITGLADLLATIPNPLARPGRSEHGPDAPPPRPGATAPRTPFNRAITPHRRIAVRSGSLATVKAVKSMLGVTVNDVVMAVCAGALRGYLLDHDALPDEPLVAMIPVSIRTGAETDKWTNRVSGIVAPIPTDVDDPVERVRRVHQAMLAAKERFALMPADVLTDFAQFSPPALAARAMRVASQFRMADRIAPTVNLVISNVPGPRQPLYLGAARVLHYYPVSTIVDGQGLNITVQSYLDNLDFGLVGCRELVPDIEHLADLLISELSGLAAATGGSPAGNGARRRRT